ncbi:MAG: M23 family peptidase, partial [Cyanobacteria bacterium J06592_8]
MKLKILKNTVFKDRPIQSNQVAYNRKISAYLGTEFEIETYNFVGNNHIKVTFKDPRPRNHNTWYVFLPHVEIIEGDDLGNSTKPNQADISKLEVDSSLEWIWPMKGTSMGSRT